MFNQYIWQTIQQEGKRINTPVHKKRALIREYLQSKIIYYLYQKKSVHKLSFIGGTSLRILRGLDRFSEDLDFDNLGLSFNAIKKMFSQIEADLIKEGIETKFSLKKTNNSGIGSFKFANLLIELGISSHRDEKLEVKINYTTPKIKPAIEVLILSRFGLVSAITTNIAEVLLAQKIKAIIQRKDIQPRDFYDVIWFLSQNIMPNLDILKELNTKQEKIAEEIIEIYRRKLLPQLKSYQARLRPFLVDEKKVSYLSMFDKIVENKLK